ncbi:superoxide dismutase family protein [Tenuibacillus multivorans]|uniref:Superoxide dismutase, Cu-Zn family n=1 Tax=Tenuibacillus multivorans TaxID=237069 RepID=A0A1H0FS71_9BACI|nr:superoxide dismutase family protein [Tenuibacillus multivorans]GEL77907.1 superoxide dismutase [Tenuibacillus multivorans]SDN97434.1 superoxide dismutase, Cu-Zn family [Tenuibacillus multivorans]
MRKLIFLIGILIILSACQADAEAVHEIDIKNQDLDIIGKAKFQTDPGGVKVSVTAEGLTPGFHGIHLHEFPKCEPPNFESAGNHWSNEADKKHGLMHPEGHHIGDMTNLEVSGDGTVAKYEYVIEDATLQDGNGSIFKDGGKALIIHSGQDDGVSQPSGESGERIACGEIIKGEERSQGQNPGDQVEKEAEEK